MLSRFVFNTIVKTARVNPTSRALVPVRWQSSTSNAGSANQGSGFSAGLAGGLTVLVGGFAWYHFSGTRQMVNAARDATKKAKELKETVKDKAGDSGEVLKYLRSATATLIPGSAPFFGKVFDQIEEISKEHGDDVKKIFEETYQDFEKLTKSGSLDSQTASKAVDILQKRVKQVQDLAGTDVFGQLFGDNPQLKEKISEQYKNLKDIAAKAKDKKPEVEKLLKDTAGDLAKIVKDKGLNDKAIKEAQELLKKKAEEAKKLGEDVANQKKKN